MNFDRGWMNRPIVESREARYLNSSLPHINEDSSREGVEMIKRSSFGHPSSEISQGRSRRYVEKSPSSNWMGGPGGGTLYARDMVNIFYFYCGGLTLAFHTWCSTFVFSYIWNPISEPTSTFILMFSSSLMHESFPFAYKSNTFWCMR